MEAFATLYAHWDQILMGIGAIGVAAESLLVALAALCWTLKKASDVCYSLAGLTATKVDDSFFWMLSVAFTVAAEGLERAAAWVPRLRPGKGAARPGVGTMAAM